MSQRGSEKEAFLSILKGERESIVLKIEKAEIRVGASLLCDISLPQSGLSDFHFEIINRGRQYFVRPNSKEGLLLNNKVIDKEAPLRDGSVIRAGDLQFLFRVTTDYSSGSTAILEEEENEKDLEGYLVLKSPEGEKVFQLNKRKATLLGSGECADIRIDDRYVSERHCLIFAEKNTFFIKDNLSRNGTFVNGIRTREAEIKDGSIIRIGKTELVFRTEGIKPSLKVEDQDEFCGIIGHSERMKEIFALIKRIGPADVPVLITGESGTGKELVARAIFKNSLRADKIFIPLNCSSIAKDVIESELFGHIKGSFTGAVSSRKGIFEEASDGTVFLDEIGDMPLELQAKLLRTIEYGEVRPVGSNRPITVNTRVLSATNKNLLEEARARRFREDLFYRLGVVHIHIPPLRERREDILPIAETFLKRFAPSRNLHLSESARKRLLSYSWPGNVRELKNVIIRSILFTQGEEIDDSSILFQSAGLRDYMQYADRFIKIKPLFEVEKDVINSAMNLYNGNIELVAERLGLGVNELREKIEKYGKEE